LGFGVQSLAQTDPGTANLKHQWTFDEGVKDHVGNLEGILVGNAKISNKALNTTTGGYFKLPAEQIAINTYPELTVEVWFTSSTGLNTAYSYLSYFGATVEGDTKGYNYHLISAARGGNVSRTCISVFNTTRPWESETLVNGPEYDDGVLHHMVSVVSETTISFYIDGVIIGSAELSADNKLINISTQKALLAAGGYTHDPTWKGNIHKYSIYNKALTDANILYMYMDGPEDQEVMTASASVIVLDSNYPAEMFNFSSSNLSNEIQITPPAGISVEPSTITKNQNDVPVAVIWDLTTPVDGNLVFKSGTTELAVKIKTINDSECSVRLYDDLENIVPDMGCNSLGSFAGWGTKSLISVLDSAELVYCGANAISVGNGSNTCSGSLDVPLTGLLQPSKTYLVRAWVKTTNGTMQIGAWGVNENPGFFENKIDTKGEWMPMQFTFTTGETLNANSQGMYFNNCGGSTGTIGYIDNWEMYEVEIPVVSVDLKEVVLDPEYKSVELIVSGTNMTQPITFSAPAGISFNPSTLTPNGSGLVIADTVTLSWDGASAIADSVKVNGSGVVVSIQLKTITTSNSDCFVPLYTDRPNLVPDPYLNNPAKFGGWGAKQIVSVLSEPDSVMCGSHTGLISGSGSMDVILTGLLEKKTQYIARLQVKTYGGEFQLGGWGMDMISPVDISERIDTQGSWSPVTLTFVTGDSLNSSQGMFINNYLLSGTRAYFDNWELYNLGPVGIVNPEVGSCRLNLVDGRIVAGFFLSGDAPVEIVVYNAQGAQLGKDVIGGVAGQNRHTISTELVPGVYIVKVQSEGKQYVGKLIK
jgi:hypothetical protein